MTRSRHFDPGFDQRIADWLEADPDRAPSDVLDTVLAAAPSIPQRRSSWVPWRSTTMNRLLLAGAAIAALVAVGLGSGFMSRAPAPAVGTEPSVTPSSAPSAGPSPTAVADPIPDGTYVGPSIPVPDIVAYINADPRLTAAQKVSMIKDNFGIEDHKTWSASLEFSRGRYTQRQHVDGQTAVGSRATYSFTDAHTLVVHEECDTCGLTGFTVTPTADGFSLKLIGAPPTEQDAVAVKFLFEYGPFVRTP